jgi:hypothetical protein
VLTHPSRAHHVETILQRAAAAGAVVHDVSKSVSSSRALLPQLTLQL